MNLASRLESHGTPGRIHVSERTRQLLQRSYRFEPRGPIDLKGIGTLSTSFLTGRKPHAAVPPRDPSPERDAESMEA